MAIAPFLAMTAAEMGKVSDFPPKIAWMACHFSPYGLGLSNLPKELPPQSMIVLDDITPIRGHDCKTITQQLLNCVEEFDCYGILLDFQRPNESDISTLAKHLVKALPCPVIVSESYAADVLSCGVFLPPLPPSVPLRDQLASWEDRDVWLEIGLSGEILRLSESGCRRMPLLHPSTNAAGFTEERLHCHYTIETNETSASFTLWRTMEDLKKLLTEAESHGISGAVGLIKEPFSCIEKGSFFTLAHKLYVFIRYL